MEFVFSINGDTNINSREKWIVQQKKNEKKVLPFFEKITSRPHEIFLKAAFKNQTEKHSHQPAKKKKTDETNGIRSWNSCLITFKHTRKSVCVSTPCVLLLFLYKSQQQRRAQGNSITHFAFNFSYLCAWFVWFFLCVVDVFFLYSTSCVQLLVENKIKHVMWEQRSSSRNVATIFDLKCIIVSTNDFKRPDRMICVSLIPPNIHMYPFRMSRFFSSMLKLWKLAVFPIPKKGLCRRRHQSHKQNGYEWVIMGGFLSNGLSVRFQIEIKHVTS